MNPDVVSISVSDSLCRLDLPLLKCLARNLSVAQWQYQQDLDEGSCLDTAVLLLHEYLSGYDQPVHLVGHGLSGLLGIEYAHKFPERVKSLCLISVGVFPALTWHSHYYAKRRLLPCSQSVILMQMGLNLFGEKNPYRAKVLAELLAKDLGRSLCPHSLFRPFDISPKLIPVPLLVCNSRDDMVLGELDTQGWIYWLKSQDVLWQAEQGKHFFHYFHPQLVSDRIMAFWQTQTRVPCASNSLEIAIETTELI